MLIDQYNESQVGQFQQRVQVAMLAAAINIQSEAGHSLQATDSAAAATSVTVQDGTQFAVNGLATFGQGLGTAETRKITAIAGNVLTVSALTNAHKAGEVVQSVVYNHTNRANYAKLVLNNPAAYSLLFASAICAHNAALTFQNDGTTTDSTINNEVSSVWDGLSGTI